MHLIATPGAVIAVFKVLNNTCLTKGMEAFSYCGWLDKISFTDVTGDMRIEIFHQVLPQGSHSWGRRCWLSALGQRREFDSWRCCGSQELLCATAPLQAFDGHSRPLTGTSFISPAPFLGRVFSYQHLYSRFCSGILPCFLCGIIKFLLIP